MRKRISQAAARGAIKRLKELERQREQERLRWGRSYPGGVHMATFTLGNDRVSGLLDGAQRMQHPLVAVVDENQLRIYAI